MTDFQTDLQIAIERVRREGSDEALWDLVKDYGPAIQRVISRRLDPKIRSKFDSIDFVQMMWASFFRKPELVDGFEQPAQLMGYLKRIAENKLRDEIRRRKTQKYNVGREEPLDPASPEHLARNANHTPSQYAIAHERWAGLMNSESERNRAIVRLRIQGATYVEIAEKLGIHERTVRKVIERLVATTPSKQAS